jgi:hypothetical protein
LRRIHAHVERSSPSEAEASARLVEEGRGNSKVEKDSANRRNPESFQYGREAFEIGTNEPNAFPVRGEVGPTRLQRFGIPIDTDERGLRRRVEKATRVAASSERGVHDHSTPRECSREELDDAVGEDGFMCHDGREASVISLAPRRAWRERRW